MIDIKKRLELFISELKKEEDNIQQKMIFYKEHNLNKEYEYIREKFKIINEIKLEAELITESKDYNPRFYFNNQ